MIAALVTGLSIVVGQIVITNPRWETPASPELLEDPMPPFAATIGVDAAVELECRTLPRLAAPQQCEVISSSVRNMGFEEKAVEVAATGLLQPRTIDNVATASRIRFTVRFHAEDLKAASSHFKGPVPSPEQMQLARELVDRFGEWEATKYEAYPELEPVRRARVNLWVRELIPVDEAAERENAATFMARLMSESELKTALTTGRPPEKQPTQAEFENAMAGLDDWTQDQIDTLRKRYCADYDCGQVP